MTALEVIALAERHAPEAELRSSAELCIGDARAWLAAGDETAARQRAARSLAYSVGVFHPAYKAAVA